MLRFFRKTVVVPAVVLPAPMSEVDRYLTMQGVIKLKTETCITFKQSKEQQAINDKIWSGHR